MSRLRLRVKSSGSHPSRGAWIEIVGMSGLRNPTACRTPHGVRGLKYSIGHIPLRCRESHPSRGAWIEIRTPARPCKSTRRRTPHGVRGLKFDRAPRIIKDRLVAPLTGCVDWNLASARRRACFVTSHPSRGAWIEITSNSQHKPTSRRRTPHGVRGLKLSRQDTAHALPGRTPHGVRGLK